MNTPGGVEVVCGTLGRVYDNSLCARPLHNLFTMLKSRTYNVPLHVPPLFKLTV